MMSRFLWDHEKITYRQAVELEEPDGTQRTATPVEYDGKPVGHVSRTVLGSGWSYRLNADSGKPWTGTYETRADAADNMLSHWSPSAAWLS